MLTLSLDPISTSFPFSFLDLPVSCYRRFYDFLVVLVLSCFLVLVQAGPSALLCFLYQLLQNLDQMTLVFQNPLTYYSITDLVALTLVPMCQCGLVS